MCCNKVLYLQNFLGEIGIILGEIPVINIGNTSAVQMVQKNIKSRVKHLDRKIFWIRDYIANKNVVVKHCDTKLNIADMYTKYVTNSVIEKLRPALMGREYPPTE